MKLHKKKKSMKYWWIDQIVYSHFLVENWKVKMLGTITARINIEKLNERGKKRLNAKLEGHLARPHTLLRMRSLLLYIYIDWLPPISTDFKVSLIVHSAWVTFYFISSHLQRNCSFGGLLWRLNATLRNNISPFKHF